VRDEEGSTDGAAIGIRPIWEKDLDIVLVVVDVHSSIKGHYNHLWSLEKERYSTDEMTWKRI